LEFDDWIDKAVQAEWTLNHLRGMNIDLLPVFGLDPKTGEAMTEKKAHRKKGEKGPIDQRQWDMLNQEVAQASVEAAIKPHEIPADQMDSVYGPLGENIDTSAIPAHMMPGGAPDTPGEPQGPSLRQAREEMLRNRKSPLRKNLDPQEDLPDIADDGW